jgi:hypothetical protein
MAKPNKKRIEKEIKDLTEIKPKVRHFSMFGDDNHKCIEAQIEVLTNNLSDEQIDDKWGGEVCDESAPALSLYDNATEARAWLDGESELKTLVEDWRSLIYEFNFIKKE